MDHVYPFELLEEPAVLAGLDGWSEAVYQDFLGLQSGTLSASEFRARHCRRRAILALDMTGFTLTSMRCGELDALLRVFNAQKVCVPVLQAAGARHLRCFADDIVALFDEPGSALDAAVTIHDRVEAFNASPMAGEHPAECCIGIGFGDVFSIGPNRAQGEEMNLASKLGEDIARSGEVLVTERARQALGAPPGIRFERRVRDDELFEYFEAVRCPAPA